MNAPLATFTLTLLAVSAAATAQVQRATGLQFLDDAAYKSIPLAATPLLGDLPKSVDLSPRFPVPGNQGAQASCVGWATAYAFKTYQEYQEHKWSISVPGHQFSPAYIYNQINQSLDCKGGTTFVDALNLLRREGVSALDQFPYSDRSCDAQPDALTKQQARAFAIADWRRVNVQDDTEVKTNIASGFPVLIGMIVDEGFANLQSGRTYTAQVGRSLGGHAMVVVGYNDDRSAFKVINSWGTDWGDDGFGWISYSAFRQTVREGYVAQDIVVSPPITPNPPVQPIGPTPQPAPPPLPQPTVAGPVVTMGVPSHIQNVSVPSPRGPIPGMRIVVPANVSNAAGRMVQVVVKFGYFNGPPLNANPQETVFRDVGGLVATGTPVRQVGSNNEGLSSEMITIPYYALNFLQTGGRSTYMLAFQAFVYVDNQLMGQSVPVAFGFTW